MEIENQAKDDDAAKRPVAVNVTNDNDVNDVPQTESGAGTPSSTAPVAESAPPAATAPAESASVMTTGWDAMSATDQQHWNGSDQTQH